MPIVLDKDIPAYKILTDERIFVMDSNRAVKQDIRPIEIAILNLMPTKETTETQFMRLLSNSPLQVNITLIRTSSYTPTHTGEEHLARFYKSFDEIKNKRFDGMIVTGAPVEDMEFEDVAYWKEITSIFDWTKTNVTSTLFICWGAFAALYYFYGIRKRPLKSKCFGVFAHKRCRYGTPDPLMRGISDTFHMPHSRHTSLCMEDVTAAKDLVLLAKSRVAGASIIRNKDESQIFVTGHMEYDRDTLAKEYYRDLDKGLEIAPPKHYFADAKKQKIRMNWTSTSNLFYINWLNYCVYQVTPYKL